MDQVQSNQIVIHMFVYLESKRSVIEFGNHQSFTKWKIFDIDRLRKKQQLAIEFYNSKSYTSDFKNSRWYPKNVSF